MRPWLQPREKVKGGGESLMYMVQHGVKATSHPPGVPGPAVGGQQNESGW